MLLPAKYREALVTTAVRLWITAEAANFTDPGNGSVAGFATIPNANRKACSIQVTGGDVWVTFNQTVAASGYGFLLKDGNVIDFGVPYHQLSFILAASTPKVRLCLRG